MLNTFYAFLLLIGLLALSFSIGLFWKSKTLFNNGIITKAEVIRVLKKFETKPGNATPVFKYYDQHGKEFLKENPVATSPSYYKVGDVVDLVYNPKKPEESKVISFWGLFRWSILLAILGFAFLIMGGGYQLFKLNYQI